MISESFNVVYLERTDLTVTGLLISFDEIELIHINELTKEEVQLSDIVIYKEEGKYKVLKSRY